MVNSLYIITKIDIKNENIPANMLTVRILTESFFDTKPTNILVIPINIKAIAIMIINVVTAIPGFSRTNIDNMIVNKPTIISIKRIQPENISFCITKFLVCSNKFIFFEFL